MKISFILLISSTLLFGANFYKLRCENDIKGFKKYLSEALIEPKGSANYNKKLLISLNKLEDRKKYPNTLLDIKLDYKRFNIFFYNELNIISLN